MFDRVQLVRFLLISYDPFSDSIIHQTQTSTIHRLLNLIGLGRFVDCVGAGCEPPCDHSLGRGSDLIPLASAIPRLTR